jgi:hypothetical protein
VEKKNAEKNKQWTNVVPSPLTLNQTLTQCNNQKGSKVRLCWVLKVGHP